MRRSVLTHMRRSNAAWLLCLLLATLAVPINAQVAVESHPQHPSRFGYDKAHEITLNGTIEAVVSHSAPGAPTGLHLLMTSSQGTVDAHLGPYLSKEVQQTLRNGVALQVVGATAQFHGKSYLLAREIIFGGRTITIRSENGFLVQGKPVRASRNAEPLNGGAR
jgi:hypothetical protein